MSISLSFALIGELAHFCIEYMYELHDFYWEVRFYHFLSFFCGFIPPSTHSLPSLTRHSLPHSLTPSLTRSLPPSLAHSHTHSLPYSLPHTHSLPHSLSPSLTPSLTHSLTHSLPLPLPHSLTHSLTHTHSRTSHKCLWCSQSTSMPSGCCFSSTCERL